jgi:hypothetical protein
MRRILRKIASQDTSNLGDVTTLADPGIVEEIKDIVADYFKERGFLASDDSLCSKNN